MFDTSILIAILFATHLLLTHLRLRQLTKAEHEHQTKVLAFEERRELDRQGARERADAAERERMGILAELAGSFIPMVTKAAESYFAPRAPQPEPPEWAPRSSPS